MNNIHDEIEFNEDDAVEYIWSFIPEVDRKSLTREDIQNVLDLIYDYYDNEGLISEDTAESASIDEEQMYNYIKENAAKYDCSLSDELIQLILDGEFEYGVSIGIYSEDDEDSED